ncbi:YdaU family protein [Derxia gummosa]|uniref:YdaU family protein n=1 Tax=Derxia gummosa DSM 723 TaxID=1121388 RepID=A0A8B6X988_9BURK|nr:DUF1376 domain-containing protein [Derxia gummosa]
MNYFKLHIGDYLRATAHLSLLEHGIYLRLMQVYYVEERAIPADRAARLIGARTPEELAALDAVLKDFFELHDGAWHQHRCEQELSAMAERVAHNREVGKRGGRPKKPKAGDSGSAEKPAENPPGFSREPEPNPIHKPIANNQEEERDSAGARPDEADGCATALDLSIALRRDGIESNPDDPRLIALAALAPSARTVRSACQTAKEAKPGERVPVGYVVKVIETLHAQAQQVGHRPAPPPRASPAPRRPEKFNPTAYVNRNRTNPEDDRDVIDVTPR